MEKEFSEKKQNMLKVLNRKLQYETSNRLEQVEMFRDGSLKRRLENLDKVLSNSERTPEEKVFDLKDTLEYLAQDFAKLSKDISSYVDEYRASVGFINALEYYEANPEKLNN